MQSWSRFGADPAQGLQLGPSQPPATRAHRDISLQVPGEMLVPTQATSMEQEGTEIAELSPGGKRLG